MPATAEPQETESLAVITDLTQAAMWLETAIHATTGIVAANAVSECAAWLDYAADTYNTAGDTANAGNCLAAGDVVSNWTVPLSQPGLSEWQTATAYPFHATIAGLIDNESARLARAEGIGLAFLGVLGLLVLTSLAGGYIDWKQTHGGYRREAPGVPTPLVSYRYPQGRSATRGRRRSR